MNDIPVPVTTDRNAKPRQFGLIAARSKREAESLATEIAQWLSTRDRGVVLEDELGKEMGRSVEAIVVLGGDGLMMRVANTYPDVPLLGINFGKVGFLALVERSDWRKALEALDTGDFAIQRGSTLEATLVRDQREIERDWAINDVVIRGGPRMIEVELYIDQHYVNTYPGDGMIVATAHGSTAYGMAAGGPILTAGVRGFALVPISCHSPIRTPLVAPEEALIELLLANDHPASLILDGRPLSELRRGDLVIVRRGVHTFQLVTFSGTNFYEAFRTKFNFQIRPDAVPTRRRNSALRAKEPAKHDLAT